MECADKNLGGTVGLPEHPRLSRLGDRGGRGNAVDRLCAVAIPGDPSSFWISSPRLALAAITLFLVYEAERHGGEAAFSGVLSWLGKAMSEAAKAEAPVAIQLYQRPLVVTLYPSLRAKRSNPLLQQRAVWIASCSSERSGLLRRLRLLAMTGGESTLKKWGQSEFFFREKMGSE